MSSLIVSDAPPSLDIQNLQSLGQPLPPPGLSAESQSKLSIAISTIPSPTQNPLKRREPHQPHVEIHNNDTPDTNNNLKKCKTHHFTVPLSVSTPAPAPVQLSSMSHKQQLATTLLYATPPRTQRYTEQSQEIVNLISPSSSVQSVETASPSYSHNFSPRSIVSSPRGDNMHNRHHQQHPPLPLTPTSQQKLLALRLREYIMKVIAHNANQNS
jgi:hypothetical protein